MGTGRHTEIDPKFLLKQLRTFLQELKTLKSGPK